LLKSTSSINEDPSVASTSKNDEATGHSEKLNKNRSKPLAVEHAEEDKNILGTLPVKTLPAEPLKDESNESGVLFGNMFGVKQTDEKVNSELKNGSDSKLTEKLTSKSGFPEYKGGLAFGSGVTSESAKDDMFSIGIFGKKQSQTNFAEMNPLTGKFSAQPGDAQNEEVDDDDPEKFKMHDQTALFQGQASTGHETETLIKSVGPAKLYRFDQKQWKARGTGKFQFWQTPVGRIRLVMRENLTEKLRLNHYIDPQLPLELKDSVANVYMWVGNDYCPEDGGTTGLKSQSRSFSAKFKLSDKESIASFKESYENAQQKNMKCAPTQE